MLEIYFDGVLLDSSKYMSLSQKGTMFDKTFKLGSVISREFILKIPKADFNPNTKEVYIKYMSNDYAHLIIDSYKYSEGGGIPSVELTLCDKMVFANFNYDASPIVPTTTLNILKDICSKIGVELATEDFPNNDISVNYFDNSIQARTYISYISEISGGFARIGNDGKMYIVNFSNTQTQSIIPELCEQIIIGQKHKIERVVFDNGIVVFKTSEDETLETLYLNSENVYINTQEEFNKVVSKILNFIYYNIDTGNTYILPLSQPGDVLELEYENIKYYTIAQYDEVSFMGSWNGTYKLELDSSVQAETKTSGISTQVKAIKIKQNRDENTLTIAVQDIQTQKDTTNIDLINKINANQTLIYQTADEINSSVSKVEGQLNGDLKDVITDINNINSNLQAQIKTNTTLIKQLADGIISTMKSTGGNNLLRNSVGLAGTDFWEVTDGVGVSQDTYTEQNTISGSKFIINGVGTLKQSYVTQTGILYGVGFKLRHIIVGTANDLFIRIHRTETDYDEILVDQSKEEFTDFRTFNTYTYTANIINPYIEIVNTGSDIVEISDLIISIGENQNWSGYFDEVYGKEHRLDKYGLKLSDLGNGNYSKLTSTGILFMENNSITSQLDKNVVKSSSGEFTNKYTIRKLQVVALDDDNVVEYV